MTDETGRPVPFSWDALVQFCNAVPALFPRLLMLASRTYSGMNEESEKNSGEPHSARSGAAAATESNQPSPNGSGSAAPAGSVNSST